MSAVVPEDHLNTITLIESLVASARQVSLSYFRNDPETHGKASASGFDPVTIADREAERVMRDILARERPDDAIVGEEFGKSPGSSGWTWYLDPIDGTRAFVAGLTSWTTLIGLSGPDDMPIYGAIAAPALDEVYLGWPGGAGLRHGDAFTKIQVSGCNDLREATISTTDPFIFTPAEEGAWTHLRATARLTRYGLDAYAYGRLAAGTMDLVAESGLLPWDAAALVPVVRGAGGLALDWRGRPATAAGGQLVCASSEGVMEQALLALRRSAV